MSNLFVFIKKNLELFFIFVLFFLFSIPHLIDLCSGYLKGIDYDIQEFLLWNYSSLTNVIVYRDIFYPYGLLHYYRNDNLIFILLNYIITPLIFTIFFFLFRKIFKDRYFLYVSSFFLLVFAFMVTGLEIFSRYGILISFSLLYSYLLYSKKINIKLNKLFIGIILGLIFSLVNDQGSYLIFSYIFLYYFNEAVNKKIKFTLKYCRNLLFDNIFQAIGFFLGLIPLLIYLFINSSFIEYFKYFQDVGNITVVAKTPFFSFITSPANLFTISILFFAIFYLLINNFYFRKKISLSSYFQVTLIFDIILLEQKSMIRSIDRQLTFISFILCMLLFYEFIQLLSKNKIRNKLITILYTSILIIIISVSFLKFSISQFKYQDFGRVINSSLNNQCYSDNLNIFLSENHEYINVVKELKRQPGFNGKVFSFSTGDSIFYAMLGQKPPYYNAIFEGSSQDNQLQTIKYIQNNGIDFITLNADTKYVQDGVPDYIRQPIVFKYIINTYYPIERIDNHLILKRNGEKNFFSSELLSQVPAFKKYLLDVYLYRIPYSEGLYKDNYLAKIPPLIKTSESKKINLFLKDNTFSSKNKVIVIIPAVNEVSSSMNYVKLESADGHVTTIFYNPCRKDKACIVNLSNAPLFYKERIISHIVFDDKFKGTIAIYELKNLNNLW